MTDTSLFGPMVGGDEVEAAVRATLILWFPVYLAELERRNELTAGTLPAVSAWQTSNKFTQAQSGKPPWGIIVAPGTAEAPEMRGDRSYDCKWEVSVGIIVQSTTPDKANRMAKLYATAVRTILLQNPALGGVASAVEWTGEANDAAPEDYLPVGWVTESTFNVTVRGVVNAFAGPSDPTVLDPPDRPIVETTELNIERKDD